MRSRQKNKDKKKNRIKYGKSERILKIVSMAVTLLFSVVMLYPFVFTVACAMKDSSKIYEIPLKLLPDEANSLSVVLDYTGMEFDSQEEMKNVMLQDNVLTMFSISYEMADAAVKEIHVYGIKDGKTIFHSRAHQIKLQMERDYGAYRGGMIKREVLLYGERYIKACNSIGYEFDADGLSRKAAGSQDEVWYAQVKGVLEGKYDTAGALVSVDHRVKSLLNIESFLYYLQMPAYLYPNNVRIANLGFMTFVLNSFIVIGFAMAAQVILCSICAFVISRQLPPRAGRYVLLFFLASMMVPFASIMLPQLLLYKQLGAYNNYAALLLPFLYPYGFYIYLYKGFFDQIPGSYFEAAALDGAGSLYLYTKICMPLSKPIISLIALQTFLGNWNDFFWAWLVTERQELWTLSVALYNISNDSGTKQNAIMGLAVITSLPVIILTIVFSKQIKQGVIGSGIKG